MSIKLSSISLLAGSLATSAAFAFMFTRLISKRRTGRNETPSAGPQRTESPEPVRARLIPQNESVRFGEPEGRRGFSQVNSDLDLYSETDSDLSKYAQDIDGGVSARPADMPPEQYDHYDAIEADEVGSLFLSRATEAPRLFEEPLDDLAELPGQRGIGSADGFTVSEGSSNAALAPESLAPESLAPESLAPESLASESLASESLAPESLSTDGQQRDTSNGFEDVLEPPSSQDPTTVWEASLLTPHRR